jgi:hypothetical protein
MVRKSLPTSTRLWGLFDRKERWGLSSKGILLIGLGSALVAGLYLRLVHPFLAITDRTPASLLVMEGWVHPSSADLTVKEFRTGGYRFVLTTGGPNPANHGFPEGATWAESGAYWLRSAGLDRNSIRVVPAQAVERDRTYASAVALREWLSVHTPQVTAVNIATEDVHARRTRLLFQKALGDRYSVGIIALPNTEYDASRWWRYSEGVRETLGETIAYLYARLWFHPATP